MVPAVEASQEPIRVLVVDDEDDSRTLLVEMLSEADEVIVAASPSTRVLGVSAGDPTQASHEMMMGGAHGFLPKGSSVEQLLDAIRSVARF